MASEMEAFVLLSGASNDDTEGIGRDEPTGRWGGAGIGEFDLVVAIEGDDPRQLRGMVRAIKDKRGPMRSETLVVVRPIPCPVKRTSWPLGTHMALLLVEARPGKTVAAFRALDGLTRLLERAIVTGSADVLVQVGGSTVRELQDAIETVRDLPEVRRVRATYVETLWGDE